MHIRGAWLAGVALAAAAGGRAQEVTGSIVGTVVDPSGAAVPRARIALTATDRNQAVRTVESDGRGEYVAVLLPVGRYALAVDAKGFKRVVRTGIVLRTGEKLTPPLALEVGDVAEEVTVEAKAAQVELQSPAAGGSISGSEVREHALNGRNYLALVALMPGSTSDSDTDELSNFPAFSIHGGRDNGNGFMVDGADNLDHGSNGQVLTTPQHRRHRGAASAPRSLQRRVRPQRGGPDQRHHQDWGEPVPRRRARVQPQR